MNHPNLDLIDMKIAVIHNHPIHYKHLLFQSMKRDQGLDFDVLFMASQSSIRHEKISLSDDLYRSHICYDGPYEAAPGARRASWTWQKLDAIQPNFLLISGYYAVECWSAWLWGYLHRVPAVMWFESNEFDYPRYWFRELPKRMFLKGCQGAHVYGRSNKDYLVRLGLPAESILIKRAVADISKFDTQAHQKHYRKDDLTRLAYVGRLAPEKNLPVLLNAFATAFRAGATSLRLIVAGTGPDEAALKKLATGLGIGAQVEFRGYTPQNDLAAVYREADVHVLPSLREPWGLVALEAMLCRLPVIVSTQCGCAADLVSPETGWSFSPSSEKGLAAILGNLPSIPTARLRAMGDAAHDLAVLYSPENCASLVADSIRGAANAGRARHADFEYAR